MQRESSLATSPWNIRPARPRSDRRYSVRRSRLPAGPTRSAPRPSPMPAPSGNSMASA